MNLFHVGPCMSPSVITTKIDATTDIDSVIHVVFHLQQQQQQQQQQQHQQQQQQPFFII